MPGPGVPFKKGERPYGRAAGTPNRRTIEVRGVIEGAAREIGGMDRLTAWIKEDPQNEYAFWTSIYPRLVPVRIHGTGPGGEIELSVKINGEELHRRMEERGLPPMVYGVDVPVLQVEGNGAGLDAEQSNGDAPFGT